MAKKAEQNPDPKLAEFVTSAEWIEHGRGGSLLKTEDALQWFLRLHRAELIATGQLIPGRGARPTIIGPGFDALVVKILQRQSSPKSA